MIGISNLKIALVAVINLGEKIEKGLADDGKISLAEALSIGASSFGDVVRFIKSGNAIKQEYTDLDDKERVELIDLVKEELDLENDKVEVIIEKAVELLVNLEDLISTIK